MTAPAYVNSGAGARVVVSSNGVSGLTLSPPGSLVVGNLLVVHVAMRATANMLNDAFQITQVSGVWTLLFNDNVTGLARNMAWAKFVTSTSEPNVMVYATAVGTLGNAPLQGVVHQFTGVLNPGTATYVEADAVTSANASGPAIDLSITTSDVDRLALNFYYGNNVGLTPTLPPAGASGGTWTANYWSPTAAGNGPQIRLWTAPMASPGTIGGGQTGPGPGLQSWGIHGFALAPAAVASLSKVVQAMHHYIMHAGNH